MKLTAPEFVFEIISKFKGSGYEIYVVGGAVRDSLMGRIVNDWDFATNATPEEIMKLFPDAFYDNAFGTVGVAHESSVKPYEITTFRSESEYTDHRRPSAVTWGKTITDDLSRRDFTINAIALDLDPKSQEFTLIDPFNGQKDIDGKVIRAVGDANDRFGEDALRMMRAVRISAELDFTVEETTLLAIQSQAILIEKIAKERVRDEILKVLSSPHPYEGIATLRKVRLMEIILPELEKTFGVEQKSPGRHHIYDVGTHLLFALKECKSSDPIVRFATLIHDIGKPQTYKKLTNGTITFYNHEMVSAKIAGNIAERLKFSNAQKDLLIKLVRWHQFTVDEHQTDSAIRRFIRNVGKEDVDKMLDLRVADRLGGGARETSWRLDEFRRRIDEVQEQPFSIKDLKINGKDVMEKLGIESGPKVGEILTKLFDMVVAKKIENNRESLIAEILHINE